MTSVLWRTAEASKLAVDAQGVQYHDTFHGLPALEVRRARRCGRPFGAECAMVLNETLREKTAWIFPCAAAPKLLVFCRALGTMARMLGVSPASWLLRTDSVYPLREILHERPGLGRLDWPELVDSNHLDCTLCKKRRASREKELCTKPDVPVSVQAVLVFVGPRLMQKREAFDIKMPLVLWNFALCIFSTMGAIRTVPHLLYNLTAYSFDDTLCLPALPMYGNGAVGVWVAAFIYSKIPELFDTLFIVLRKRKLIFLHWYHHMTVLLYCWHAYSTAAGSGLYFVSMNYCVHAIMYGYYFLAAAKQVPKWFPTHLITIAQIGQMFIGVGICVSSFVFSSSRSCENSLSNQLSGAVMYASYFYLFVMFAIRRFVLKPKKKVA
eukprot:scaffold7817_cov277-Pinguiococcus_pyrenoidosus.AAC.1